MVAIGGGCEERELAEKLGGVAHKLNVVCVCVCVCVGDWKYEGARERSSFIQVQEQ
jgi:hypothetical protein